MSDHRRPGMLPGRRLPLVAAGCAAVAALGVGVAPASADQAIVRATIYSGSGGQPSTQPATLSKLATCPLYTGPSWSFSNGQGPFVSNTVWSVGEILTCGLEIPQGDIAAVQVYDGDSNRYEKPLTPGAVFDPATYPTGALPLISVNGTTTTGGFVTYTRPPVKASDQAQDDQFSLTGTAPVAIVVFEKQLPLKVRPNRPIAGAKTTSSERFTLGASVTTAAGAPVPSTDLSWSWSINGARVSRKPSPSLTFPASVTPVTVWVDDAATGTGGTATFDVKARPGKPRHSKHDKNGAGNHRMGGPTGNGNGKPKSGGNSVPKHSHHQKATTHRTTHKASNAGNGTQTTPQSSTTPATTTATTPQTTTATTPGFTPVDGRTKPPPHAHHTPRRHSRRNSTGSAHHTEGSSGADGSTRRRVTGRLVADIEPTPASSSSLVRNAQASVANAPLVHAATTSTSLPAWLYGALAVVALLIGGAVYERRGRHGRSLHR